MAQGWSGVIFQEKAPIDFDQEILNCPKCFSQYSQELILNFRFFSELHMLETLMFL